MLTCGTWVKRGVAKEVPDKVQLTEEDLKNLIDETEQKLRDVELEETEQKLQDVGLEEEKGDSNEQDKEKNEKLNESDIDEDDMIVNEYGLEDYDDEGAVMTGAGMAGLVYYTSEEDPYVDLKALNADEAEDDTIKQDDNLVVVGKMDEDCSCLEVYVYNENEDSLYVHHDILLESFPLCLEWLSFDPTETGKTGNFVAVGTMEPEIDVWDLDVVNTIEPAFTLRGQKKKSKKKKNSTNTVIGHKDAVLALSWNPNSVNVLASASADKTVLLWDLTMCTSVHKLTHHKDKVQAAKWHPKESESLLTGSFDKSAAVLDCRSPKAFKSWKLSGECEQVLWDHFAPYNFLVSTDDGFVTYFDVRTDSSMFTLHAHNEAVTGISLSSDKAHCLTTVSSDKNLKVWDFSGSTPICVLSREMQMGNIHFTSSCPDLSFVAAVGGDKDGLRMFNILETAQGKQYFKNKEVQTRK